MTTESTASHPPGTTTEPPSADPAALDEPETLESAGPEPDAETTDEDDLDEAGAPEPPPAEPHGPASRRFRRRGRPSKARGQPNSSDAASARWTVRGVPPPVRDMALRAAEARSMTVGDWVAEAIVAYARRKVAEQPEIRSNVPATEAPPDLTSMIERLDERLTRIEGWQRRGFFGRLFGRA